MCSGLLTFLLLEDHNLLFQARPKGPILGECLPAQALERVLAVEIPPNLPHPRGTVFSSLVNTGQDWVVFFFFYSSQAQQRDLQTLTPQKALA